MDVIILTTTTAIPTTKKRIKKMLSTVKSLIEMNTALAISAGFIGFCCLLAAIARIFVSRTIQSCLVKELLYEAIAAAELCSCCFELIIGECGRRKTNKCKKETERERAIKNRFKFKLILWDFSFFFLFSSILLHAHAWRSTVTSYAHNAYTHNPQTNSLRKTY